MAFHAPITGAPMRVPSIYRIELEPGAPDFEIIADWNLRQRALAQIEARGPFKWSHCHSPHEIAAFDAAETRIIGARAVTLQGVLAQLWVAFSHVGSVESEDDRVVHDAIRRADIDDVRCFMEDADFEFEAVFSGIEALTAIVEGIA